MRMVKWNGKYGIERGIFFKKYLDLSPLNSTAYWVDRWHDSFADCWSEDKEAVITIYKYVSAKVTPCDINELEKILAEKNET
jgi:hypothetical protein